MLSKVCERLGIEFTDRMLQWEKGPRPYDGVWAKHWYDTVNASTGFARRTQKNEPVDPRYNDLISESLGAIRRTCQTQIKLDIRSLYY